MSKRVRRGPKGLYYTDGKLDSCSYNDKAANLLQLLIRWFEEYFMYAVSDILEHLKDGALAIAWIILLPIVPFIHIVQHKRRAKDVKIEHFDKEYYEVLWEDEDE